MPGQSTQLNDDVRLYSWDVLNRMTMTAGAGTGNGATFMYRADGMRVEKIADISLQFVENPNVEDGSGFYDPVTTTNKPTYRYFYDGQMAVEEDYTNTSGSYVTRYGIGARGIDFIEKTPASGSQTKNFPLYDAHGNMVLTLARGSTANTYATGNARFYDAWGAVATSNDDGDPSQRYCANLGHPSDDFDRGSGGAVDDDLIYMRARYYEPGTGRFVSEDPALEGTNWYSYARNLPTQASDPGGTTSYFDADVQFALGFLSFMAAFAMLGTRWGGISPSKLERYLVVASVAASAFYMSNAIAGSQHKDNPYLNFMNHAIFYVATFALIAEGMEKSKYVHALGQIATMLAGLYSIACLGVIISTGLDIEG